MILTGTAVVVDTSRLSTLGSWNGKAKVSPIFDAKTTDYYQYITSILHS